MSQVVEMPKQSSSLVVPVGTILYVKTTGEPVSFLKGRLEAGSLITGVRRAIQSDTGLVYVNDEFYPTELETFEERLTRRAAEARLEISYAKKVKEERETVN